MDFDSLHKPDNSKPVVFISRESVELLDDVALVSLLKTKGVDCRRKTRVTEHGAVYYAD